jgi:DNA repair protein RecN (Recombination protein N)
MLKSIFIKNIALISQIQIDFTAGFCIFSGETGSGKSILLDAIGMATGSRVSSKIMRQKCDNAFVIAEFSYQKNDLCHQFLQENFLEGDENNIVFLKRNLTKTANKAFINDIPVSIRSLKKIGDLLLEIHGQHQQKNLFDQSYHKIALDQYANCEELKNEIFQIYQKWKNSKNILTKLLDEQEKIIREKEYLEHIIAEIENLSLAENEEHQLLQQKQNIHHKSQIISLTQDSLLKNEKISSDLFTSQQNLIKNKDKAFSEEIEIEMDKAIEVIEEIFSKSNELSNSLDTILHQTNQGDLSIEEIDERLFVIRNISRKLNISSQEIPNFLAKSKKQLKETQILSENIPLLEKELANLKNQYLEKAQNLSDIRKHSGQDLKKNIEHELQFLDMKNVQFMVKIETFTEEENFRSDGIDKISFLVSTNKNAEFGHIAKIASGGELSRFTLAMKVSMLKVSSAPVLIFDEIDTGVGGATTEAIGNRLKKLSHTYQTMVITHQPQIAAKADFHLLVSKEHLEKETLTKVRILKEQERILEVARMISGKDITQEAVAAAKKL